MKTEGIVRTALASLLLLGMSTGASAAFTEIADDRADGGRGGSLYDTNSMAVDWTPGSNTLNVRVYTNFTSASSSWDYGDLLIGTNDGFTNLTSNSKADWNYAFHLSDRNANSTRGDSTSVNNQAEGWLLSTYYHGLTNGKEDNNENYIKVNADTPPASHGSSDWVSEGSWYQSDDIGDNLGSFLNFTFSTSSFNDPTQIAFRWAMTCANDVVAGVAYKPTGGGSNGIPEPTIIALMLAGLAGVGFTRRRREDRLVA